MKSFIECRGAFLIIYTLYGSFTNSSTQRYVSSKRSVQTCLETFLHVPELLYGNQKHALLGGLKSAQNNLQNYLHLLLLWYSLFWRLIDQPLVALFKISRSCTYTTGLYLLHHHIYNWKNLPHTGQNWRCFFPVWYKPIKYLITLHWVYSISVFENIAQLNFAMLLILKFSFKLWW